MSELIKKNYLLTKIPSSLKITKKIKKDPARFIELDALRGIAIMFVIVGHFSWAYDSYFKTLDEHIYHFQYGHVGVETFFIISGFAILLTLEKMDSLKIYITHRISALYPSYWVSVLITVFVITMFPVPTISDYTLNEILVNLTMFQGFFKVRLVDGVYWTLKIQLLYYIIMGLIFYFKQLQKIEIISFVWLLFIVFTLVFDFPLEKYFRVLAIVEHAPLFIAGMMFYKIKYKSHNYVTHIIIFLSLIIYLFSYNQTVQIRFHEPKEMHLLLVILLFLLFYLLINFNIKFFQNKYLLFLGSISYPLYLVHNMVGVSIIYRIKMIADNVFVYTFIPIILTISLAFIVKVLMKKPSLYLKNKLLS